MTADFLTILNNLVLKLDENHCIEDIYNRPTIFKTWNANKTSLLKKYEDVPNIDQLLENFSNNLEEEGKIEEILTGKGIYELFFPKIIPYIRTKGRTQFTRKKTIKGMMIGVDVDVLESLSINENAEYYRVKVDGQIHPEYDYALLNKMCQHLYGFKPSESDIILKYKEDYILQKKDLKLYKGGQSHHFTITDCYFKIDEKSYKPKEA